MNKENEQPERSSVTTGLGERMTNEAYLDINYKVGEQGEDATLTISTHHDNPGNYLIIHTESAADKDYWGDFSLTLSLPVASMLSKSIALAVKNAKEQS